MSTKEDSTNSICVILPTKDFFYLGFYVAFNTVQVISRRVVGRAEETSTYSSLGQQKKTNIQTNGQTDKWSQKQYLLGRDNSLYQRSGSDIVKTFLKVYSMLSYQNSVNGV